ncbi:MAG: hypothetical protein PHE83_16675 [Opitutaceae bacterium]|nr:hypothetical protein [Opitutaceae bacterium]
MNALSAEVDRKVRQVLQDWEVTAGVKLARGAGEMARIPLDQFSNYTRLRHLLTKDTTGGFALVCALEELAEEIGGNTVTLREFLAGPSAETQSRLKLLAEVQTLTDDPVIKSYRRAVTGLVSEVLDAIEVSGDNRQKVVDLIQRPDLGDILQKAGVWIEHAEKHQLNRGTGRGDRFRLNTWVHAFTSIDLAARAIQSQPIDGLTLCLILDQPAEYSFFALGLKVGERVFLFHEDTGIDHRDQLSRRRNPGRDLERRLQDNYFPYESAFNFAVRPTASGSGEQYRITLGKAGSTSLTDRDQQANRLLRVADLDPHEILWLVLLAYRLREDYWIAGREMRELSYTGSMVALTLPSGKTTTTAIALARNDGINLGSPTLQDVMNIRPEDYRKLGWSYKPVGHNIPLLGDYADVLNPDILWGDEKLLLGDGGKACAEEARDGITSVPRTHLDRFGGTLGFEKQLAEGHLLATKHKMEALQMHEARKRVAKALQAALNLDFNQNRDRVGQWIQNQANNRAFVDRVRMIAVNGRFDDIKIYPQGSFGTSEHPKKHKANVVGMDPLAKTSDDFHVFGSNCAIALYHPAFEAPKGPKQCCVMRGKCRKDSLIFVTIKPTTAQGLAELFGISVADLPRSLRHWSKADPYYGNTILDHLDPLDLVENPWLSLKIQVSFYVSKMALDGWKQAIAAGKPLPLCPAKVWFTALDFAKRPADAPA